MLLVLISCSSRPKHIASDQLDHQSLNPTAVDFETSLNWENQCENQQAAYKDEYNKNFSSRGWPCYQVDLVLRPEYGTFMGKQRVIFTNTFRESINEVNFRLYPNAPVIFGGALIVEDVKVNGNSVTPSVFLNDSTGLRIPLPSPLLANETVEIVLTFSGSIPSEISAEDFLYGTFYQGDQNDLWVMANAFPILENFSEGKWTAREVIPGGDPVTSQTALFTFRIKIPQDWKVASTGSMIQETMIHGYRQMVFISGPARDFMIVAGKNLQSKSKTMSGGIQINHWSANGLVNDKKADIALKIASQALEIFQNEYGPYPFRELDIVVVALDNALGVEFPGLILLQDDLYRDPDEFNTFAIVIAHEIAHQWWYNMVGNDTYEEPWLDEALATYSGFLYARRISLDFYQGVTQYAESRVSTIEAKNGSQPFDQPIEFYLQNQGLYSAIVYQKGALFLDALRKRLGDQVFNQAMQSYYLDFQYQLVQSEDIFNEFENACSCNLDSFYLEWDVSNRP